MNAVIYYSNTGQSKRVAGYLAEKTSFPLYGILEVPEPVFETAILVFPVHCQSVPDCVKDFLKRLRTRALIVVATYGRMCCGNVLNYIQRRYPHSIIAGAYVPAKHSYIEESGFEDFEKLDVLLTKINNLEPVKITVKYRNPLAGFLKGARSRAGVKIYRDESCTNCGICNGECNFKAIQNGKTNRRCIRCLKCVSVCPQKSLHFKLRLPMRIYLRKKKQCALIIYV